GSRFGQEAAVAPFGWAAVRRLAARYEASLEAAARQYVISRSEAGLLLVAGLRPEVVAATQAVSGEPLLAVRYAAASPTWRERYGHDSVPAPGTPLPWPHPATRIMLSASRAVLRTPLEGPLGTDPRRPLAAELLSNGYEVLMLARGQRPG
ncbi:MAG TPA: hypothetical protein VM536_04785, partial [Chloroflexia bacterium]|nr:hypothetical protein [Chloroflexia bacterium]